jgi:hypothetical protein
MEVLLFNVLDARDNTQKLEMYAGRRNGRQEVTDLKPVPIPGKGKEQVASALLPSFLAGYRLFKR